MVPTGGEIRRNRDGSLDEIVADDVSVHLEQMDDDEWWLGISRGDKILHVQLWLNKKTRHIELMTEDEGLGLRDYCSEGVVSNESTEEREA